jgi:PAS domain S-box-containing protein
MAVDFFQPEVDQEGAGRTQEPFSLEQAQTKPQSQEEYKTARRLLDEIAERLKAEAALRKSQEMLASLIESAPDASVIVDPAGKIVRVNRQAEVMFGYSRAELLGSPIDMLLPERYLHSHSHNREKFLDNMSIRPMGAGLDLYALRKDGSEFPVDIMLSPIQAEDGKLVISSIRDISAQKRLQNELAETQRILLESVETERRVLSRDLHDGPIQDLYASMLSLEGIRAHLQSADDLAELGNVQGILQAVIQALREICGDLRPPALSHFGLQKAIQSHALKTQQTHPELQIDLSLENDANLLSDREKLALYRVYQNSMSNILRHAQARHVRVELHVAPRQVILKISDDGCGFQLPHRWVELARTGHYGLVGMSERVEAIGGHFSVSSAEGTGTTIQADLPI